MAHEVSNPLAAILGFTDLLLENRSSHLGARICKLFCKKHKEEIVQDLLSFARQRPAPAPMQVNAILRQTIKLRSYDFATMVCKL